MPRDPHICKGLGTIRSADFAPGPVAGASPQVRALRVPGSHAAARGGVSGGQPAAGAVRSGHFAGSWSSHGASRR